MVNLLLQGLWKIKSFFKRLIGARTVGARALVIQDDSILLIKHTYQPGWYTIGGGVDRGESTLQAVIRELHEEVGLKIKENPELFGIYHNTSEKRDDYVALYIVKDFEIQEAYSPEIADKKWYKLDALPDSVSPATKRRIEEYCGIRKQSDKW